MDGQPADQEIHAKNIVLFTLLRAGSRAIYLRGMCNFDLMEQTVFGVSAAQRYPAGDPWIVCVSIRVKDQLSGALLYAVAPQFLFGPLLFWVIWVNM